MNAALNELGSQLFGWFDQLSIELAALAVLVLVASRLLPIKSPALRHLLWAAVLLKPLVAVAISSPYTLFTPLASLVEPGNASALPVDHSTMQVATSPTIATSSVRLTLAGWGAILWLVGAALLIGRILIGYGIVWRLRQQAQAQHDGPLFDALRQARRTLDGYSKVEVATSPSISSPMVLGILRPIIVFPADLVEKLRTDELSLVLTHELAHVRRWDNLTMLLHRLVSAVLFFHPAVWLCGRMLRREAEQACDDLVDMCHRPLRSLCARPGSRRRTGGTLQSFNEENPHDERLCSNRIGFGAENPQSAWRQCTPDGHAGTRVDRCTAMPPSRRDAPLL